MKTLKVSALAACAVVAVVCGAAITALMLMDIAGGRIHGWQLVPAVCSLAMLGLGGIASGVGYAALAWRIACHDNV